MGEWGLGSPHELIYRPTFCSHLQAVSQSRAGKPSLCSLSRGPWPSSLRPDLEALATRAGGHQPGRALFPRNGLQWSVNGQILACHVTEGEKMSACFLYLMHKIYLNLLFFFLKLRVWWEGRAGLGPVHAFDGSFCAWCPGLHVAAQLPSKWRVFPLFPFPYFTCCDFTEPFQSVINSSFVPGPSVNFAWLRPDHPP